MKFLEALFEVLRWVGLIFMLGSSIIVICAISHVLKGKRDDKDDIQ